MQDTISLLTLNLTEKEIARFHSKIQAASPDECWPCKGRPSDCGYGRFQIRRDGRAINLIAHRVAFFLHWGIDPHGWLICHECDNRICCNPACLFIGSSDDNM
ncbi:MAG TPA: HNH endonuclease, partial [Blastocatellia bacterium]|nr:HNH endonuclease [Blastocatellia bacterium]